jgi:hypothetical protein
MIKKPPLFLPINWKGKKLKIFRVIQDQDYGEIWDGFLDHRKVYVLNGDTLTVVEEQALIDELDNRYGIPVSERGLDFD